MHLTPNIIFCQDICHENLHLSPKTACMGNIKLHSGIYHIVTMMYGYNEDYQYDGCVSRGICSINPKTASLQEVLVLYLRLGAHYALKLHENNRDDAGIKNVMLNSISIMVSNPEFSEKDFTAIAGKFKEELPRIIKLYEDLCKEKNMVPECLKSILKYNKETDIIKAVRMGEKEFLRKANSIPQDVRDLYKILFVLAKSICINVLDLESFGADADEGYITILKLLDSLNTEEQDIEKIKNLIIENTKIDNKLMKRLRTAQEERYGIQQMKEVSYSTTPGKAVLVVGSNIRELEDVLEALKEEDIDVYTHDEMMLAHTFPKFSEYTSLKGQYGQGMENCLLDFSTFPGPIILTRHSLYNVENLYRGRLYTTDFAYSKGVISIHNKDFSDVIKSANEAKGFKTGKQCETVHIGCNFEASVREIDEKIKSGKYSNVFIIGLNGYTIEQQAYFDKLLDKTPDNVLIISLSYSTRRENAVYINACFDTFAIVRFAEAVSEKLPIALFFPKCDRHTISQMIYMSTNPNMQIYVGKCTPIILNPNLIDTLHKVFGINGLTSVKKDLDDILNKK